MRRFRRFVFCLAVLSAAPLVGGAFPGGSPIVSLRAAEPARLMAVDAGLLFAQALRVKDSERRAELLEEAQAKVDRLLADYPDSPEASKLRADEKLAGLSPSILAAAREAVRREMEAGGLISAADRDRCLTRPTMSCLYDLAAVTARRLESKTRRIALLAEVAEARARSGELDKALNLARPLAYGTPDGPGARALTGIAVLQAESGQLDAALATAKSLNGRIATDEARASIVVALAAAGALEPARKIAEAIESKGPLIEARAALALARSRPAGSPETGPEAGAGTGAVTGAAAGVVDEGIEAAHRLSDPRSSDATLERLSLALVDHGDYARAATAARQIIDEATLRRALSHVATRWAEAGAVRESLRLARDLGSRNGGSRLLVQIAEVRLKAGDYAAVASILDEEAGPEAGVQVLNRVATQPLDAAQAQRWATVAAGLGTPGEKARGLAIAARALAAAGDAGAARARLGEALDAAAVLDDWERAPVMLEAAAVELFLGGPERARERLTWVPAGTFWSDEVVGLTGALARLTEPDQVTAVAAGLEDEADRQRLVLIAAQAMAARGGWAEAQALARTLPEGAPRDQAYFGIAKALMASGAGAERAAELFRQATSLQGDDQLLLEFALAQVEAGDLRGALLTGERIAASDDKARVYIALAERLRSPLAMQ